LIWKEEIVSDKLRGIKTGIIGYGYVERKGFTPTVYSGDRRA